MRPVSVPPSAEIEDKAADGGALSFPNDDEPRSVARAHLQK